MQVFRVSLSCFTGTGMKLEPKTLSGDFGENITGGKKDYMVVWDVLKDMDELQSADFSIKAELIKGKPSFTPGINLTGWDKKRYHLLFAFDFPGPKLGLKIGYMGSWGFSATFLYGKAGLNSHQRKDPDIGIPLKKVPYIGLELSKRVINRQGFQMHLSAGPSYTKWFVVNRTIGQYYTEDGIMINIGTTLDINRITFSVGIASAGGPGVNERIEGSSSDNLSLLSSTSYLVAGLGFKF